MSRFSQFTVGEEDKLIKEYLAGVSCIDIAEKYHSTRATIKSIMRKRSIISHKKGRPLGSKNKISTKVKQICQICGNTFYAYRCFVKNGEGICCSALCGRLHSGLTRRGRYIGKDSPHWIKDRTKLKKSRKRGCSEERLFVAKILKDNLYTCELTGKSGCELNVHHIYPVWSHPELRYDEENVIVIQKIIHKEFHRIFGNKTNIHSWRYFVKEKLYKKVI